MTVGVDPLLYARARQLISNRTGFRDDAIAPESLERVVRAELARGRTPQELLAELDNPEGEFAQVVVRASLVGETYFFRHPEHFRFIAREAVTRVARSGVRRLRGWSAGCATGEEAYSLAACLLASTPPGLGVEVLGTDLHEGSLASARRATYGTWSRRESGPHLFPLYRPLDERQVVILEKVRAVTSFSSANLMWPLDPAQGQFHFILCRNVLTYFSLAARELAVANLVRSLAPGGYLFLGTVEVDRSPPGLLRVGPPELQAFHRPLNPEAAAPPPPKAPSRTGLASLTPVPPSPGSLTQGSRPPSRTGIPSLTPAPLPQGSLTQGARPPSRTGIPSLTPAPLPQGSLTPGPKAPSLSGIPAIPPAPARPPPPPPGVPTRRHLEALERIEQGKVSEATAMLEELVKQYPDYLPGLLELALLRERHGARAAAYPLMRAVHARAAELPPDQLVEGPESLPARFYKASADAYLNLGAAE